jgi:hypothetical protein
VLDQDGADIAVRRVRAREQIAQSGGRRQSAERAVRKIGRQSMRSRIWRTRSIDVCGWRNANLATVSPSQADGGMKAT